MKHSKYFSAKITFRFAIANSYANQDSDSIKTTVSVKLSINKTAKKHQVFISLLRSCRITVPVTSSLRNSQFYYIQTYLEWISIPSCLCHMATHIQTGKVSSDNISWQFAVKGIYLQKT